MAINFVILSQRPEDISFGNALVDLTSKTLKLESTVHSPAVSTEIRSVLMDNPRAFVFWDVDHPKAAIDGSPESVKSVGQILGQFSAPERVFAISDKALNVMPYLNGLMFNHHIIRAYNQPGPEIYWRLTMAGVISDPFSVQHFLPEGANVQKLSIARSGQRAAAVNAVSNVFTKKGIPARLVQAVTEAVDEILMNAIFDAPVKGDKDFYRKALNRSGDFAMSAEEAVSLEIGTSTDYIVVGITDQFGSLQKDVILDFIRKNYQNREYSVGTSTHKSGGLGLYRIMQSGLSLAFLSKPDSKTEVMLFFPVVKNIKEYRSSFKFFSYTAR